jgi:hypothetical protein
MNSTKFSIPISIDLNKRREIKEVKLYVSSDEGKNWNQFAGGPPDREGFPFLAPAEGTYWFTVQVINKKNKPDPFDIYSVPPSQKIIVDTTRPDIKLTAERRGEDIAVHWDITETNPDRDSFRLEYQTQETPSKKWMPVSATVSPHGEAEFTPPDREAVRVRLFLKDKAENADQAEALVPAAEALSLSQKQVDAGKPRPKHSSSHHSRPKMELEVTKVGPEGPVTFRVECRNPDPSTVLHVEYQSGKMPPERWTVVAPDPASGGSMSGVKTPGTVVKVRLSVPVQAENSGQGANSLPACQPAGKKQLEKAGSTTWPPIQFQNGDY